MPAYVIAEIEVHDPETYETYKALVPPSLVAYGGRFLVRGGEHEVLEGDSRPLRLVVIEFPDMATLKSWYNSPEYAKLIALRQGVSRGSLVAVEGA